MWYRKAVFILFLALCFAKINAQNFELGKVSIAELQEKMHSRDTSAVAAILYKKAKTFFSYTMKNGFVANHEYEYRIKIYKKGGLDWVNFDVPYYVGYEDGNDDVVKFLSSVTYNLESGSIVKTKGNSEGRFKKKVNEYWNEASITFPNVKVGSVIELKYVLKSENLVKFPVFDLQYTIPVNYAQYNTKIPEFFIYKSIRKGYIDIKTEEKLENGTQNFEDKYNRTSIMSYKQINTTHIAENIPVLNEEDYTDNISNYKSSINYELERTRFPDEPVKDYTVNWEGVAKTIYENKNFGKELSNQSFLEQDVNKILNGVTSKMEMLEIIFKFVQNKMNWNHDYGYYTDKGVEKAYLERSGNSAEINFILIGMLNQAGINAYPVLVSTREHGTSVYPNRTGFNYVIAAVKIEGEQILLDATNKWTSPNILPLNVLNYTGRLIKHDTTSEEINLVPTVWSKKNCTLLLSIESSGKITGKYRMLRTDYEAFRFREKNTKINQEDYLEKIENDLGGVEISNYVAENNNTNFAKPVIETATLVINNQCEIIADKMFINSMLFYTLNKNPFVLEKREMPIFFEYPKQEKFIINYQIPEGYVVESIPKSIKFSTPDNVVSFIMNTHINQNVIQIQVLYEINKAIVSSDYYGILKDFYQKMIDKQNEKIILTKI